LVVGRDGWFALEKAAAEERTIHSSIGRKARIGGAQMYRQAKA
jgi:hypothetical protein